jgi:hypothetical protein
LTGIDVKKVFSVISLLFLVLFLLVSCEKSSSDWVEYNEDNDGNVWFYKKGDINKDGDKFLVKVWDNRVFSDKSREK